MPVRVLALDLSGRSGWACDGVDAVCPPRTGTYTLHTSGTMRGPAFVRFDEWLYGLIGTLRPDLVAYEAPILSGRPMGTHEAILLIGLAAHAEAMAASRGVNIVDPPPHVQTVRKSVLGHGRPEKPKRAVMNFCKQMGWDIHGDDNRADAALLWAHVKLTTDRGFRLDRASPLFRTPTEIAAGKVA